MEKERRYILFPLFLLGWASALIQLLSPWIQRFDTAASFQYSGSSRLLFRSPVSSDFYLPLLIPGALPLLVPWGLLLVACFLELPSVKPSAFTIYYTGTQTCLKQWRGLYLGINENIFGKSFNVCLKKLTQEVVNLWEVIQNGGGLLWSMHSFESRRVCLEGRG